MQTSLSFLVILISYVLLWNQYRIAAGKGAADIKEALSNENLLAVLSKRNLNVMLLMMVGSALYFLTGQTGNFLQWQWNKNMALATTLLALGCSIVSFISAQKTDIGSKYIGQGHANWYLTTRFLSLVAYEIFFRVVLLQFFLS